MSYLVNIPFYMFVFVNSIIKQGFRVSVCSFRGFLSKTHLDILQQYKKRPAIRLGDPRCQTTLERILTLKSNRLEPFHMGFKQFIWIYNQVATFFSASTHKTYRIFHIPCVGQAHTKQHDLASSWSITSKPLLKIDKWPKQALTIRLPQNLI